MEARTPKDNKVDTLTVLMPSQQLDNKGWKLYLLRDPKKI
jgi:hypothetical protein